MGTKLVLAKDKLKTHNLTEKWHSLSNGPMFVVKRCNARFQQRFAY